MAEQMICNHQVDGSNPSVSSITLLYGGCKHGRLPKRSTGRDCKSCALQPRWFESITSHHYFEKIFFLKRNKNRISAHNKTSINIRVWPSLVGHVLWEHGAAGSSPVTRTTYFLSIEMGLGTQYPIPYGPLAQSVSASGS